MMHVTQLKTFFFWLRQALVVSLTIAGTLASPLSAQNFPNHAIRFVVPQATGGASDVIARLVGQKLAERWGQQIVVDNRSGAGGNIGTEIVARAAPDGYTWLLGFVGTHAINPSLYKNLAWDAEKDFSPVAILAVVPFVVVANPSLPAKNMAELIALAKARPGGIRYGSGGNGSVNHLIGAMIASTGGVTLTHVPYRGIAIAVTNTVAGEVQFTVGSVTTALGQIRGGLLRGLAVTSAHRTELLKDVPTMAESGFPGFDVTPWFGVLAPARTPPAIVKKINAEINRLLGTREIAEKFAAQGAEPDAVTPEQFANIVHADIVRWAKVVKESGAALD
jgi:tripartite-type tricarboxylate transporter receptor subunit TctC